MAWKMKIRLFLSRLAETISILLLLYIFVGRAVGTCIAFYAVRQYQVSTDNAISEQKQKALSDAIDYNNRLAASGDNHVAEYAMRTVGEDSRGEPSYGFADDPGYEKLLNLNGDSVMGYVEIPSIGITLPIYHYASQEVLSKGVGHLYGTSLPVGGESTHAVLTGHRGFPGSRLFTDLDKVKTGDTFEIHVLDQVLCYQVEQIKTILPDDDRSFAIEEGQDLVTLMTCTPYGVNDHRLLVRGVRVSDEQTVAQAERTTGQKVYQAMTTSWVTILVGIAALILGLWRLIHIWVQSRNPG